MRTFTEKDLLDFLQNGLTEYLEEVKECGEDRLSDMHLYWLIGQKEMVECLICQPVNLQKDGKVTVGF